MIFKQGVSTRGARPEILLAIAVAQEVFDGLHQELVITSLCDGTHSERSFHYNGLAVDIRTHHLGHSDALMAVATLKHRLGVPYQVVFESKGTDNEHIHIEYDDGKEQPRTEAERV